MSEANASLQGVYANLTIQLYRELDINSLRVWGSIYAAVTLVVWSLVFVKTMLMLRNGEIFESPCIEEIDMARSTKQTSEGPSEITANGNGSGAAWSGQSTGALSPSQSL